MLSREEVGQRLESPRGKSTRQWEREALQTAQSLYAERDEAWTAYKQALNDNGVLKDLEYETRQERDALAAIVEELTVLRDEYGLADDETLTSDAIALKGAINRVWGELERMCPDALAALDRGQA